MSINDRNLLGIHNILYISISSLLFKYGRDCLSNGNDFVENGSCVEEESCNLDQNPAKDFRKYKHFWALCEDCCQLNYKKFLPERLSLCQYCGYHLKMDSLHRIELSIDSGTWDPMDMDESESMISIDAVEFDKPDVSPKKDKISSNQRKTGMAEAFQMGIGQLETTSVAIGVMDFEFIGGSMGSVVGERITRLIECAVDQSLPLIMVCASGGARMQEGSLSLMQMVKISSASYDHQSKKKLFYVSILTSPTTGGVTASFGMLGDVIFAEPEAYIAFAGKRVIEETLHVIVPEGAQETENLFEKGLFDSIVPRKILKGVLGELFEFHGFVSLNPIQAN
uniref:acetyl-CoA carboxylase beta subunit n=1 Tax=Halophila ovalis TaxID=62339 RepID=UPI00226D3EB2|nr:acetyl-CoA carboxylase beta subunit [Halophila ovalis]UZH94368.1 acetyl-CoA carboxylase beta subunit [Halophila ovalis]